MLILRVYVNFRQIDEIHVQNVGEKKEDSEVGKYKIRKPKGFGRAIIIHRRSDGWEKLMRKVLEKFEEMEKKGKEKGGRNERI